MTQTYQMKHNAQGTIYSLLTVESDGQMTMTFHGTDRELSQEANVTEDGRIATGGSLFPGLESGRWNKMEDVRCKRADVVETTEHAEQAVVAEPQPTVKSEEQEPIVVYSEPIVTNSEPIVTNSEPIVSVVSEPIVNQPRPRRQRKPRKPRVALDGRTAEHTSDISHQTSAIDRQPSDIGHQTSATLKAVGMVAAATVALLVIYETGLLIPLGLIGLATGGLLK